MSEDPKPQSPSPVFADEQISWMRQAILLAQEAAKMQEVPVGAVVIKDGRIVGQGFNLRESHCDATKHAEMDAIVQACRALGSWRLAGCELYVTLEPCVMCAGAIHQARLDRVWFGAYDPKAGAMGSLYRIHEDERLNHRLPAVGGLLGEECAHVLREFFRQRRRN